MNKIEKRKLKEVAEFSQGLQVPIEKQISVMREGYSRFIRISDITSVADERYVEIPKSPERYFVTPDDIIMVRYGDTGKVGRGFSGIIANNLFRILPKEGIIRKGFLFYFLKQQEIYEYLKRQAISAGLPAINHSIVGDLIVPILPFHIQNAISAILTILDDKIELLRSMNKTLEAIARALFRSWFIDFDPVRKKAAGKPTGLPPEIDALFPDSFEDSELGEIPKGWCVVALDRIGDFLNGIAGQKYPPKNDGKDIPVIKIAQVRANSTDGADLANSDFPNDYLVNDGDILFPWSGSLMVSIWTGGKGLLNQHIFKVKSEEHHDWLLYHWIDSHMENFQGIASDKATTMGHIQRGHLGAAKCILPDKLLESEINRIIDPIFSYQIANKLESNRLVSIRDSLLPRLISGEIELSDKDISKILEPAK